MIGRLRRRPGREAVPDARAIARELNRRYFALRNASGYNDEGVDVFAEDWDSLLILDACRFDAFAARSDLPGELDSRQSRGSMTPEWLRANFAGRDLTHTVYVSANGQFVAHNGFGAVLHDFLRVWGDEFSPGEREANALASPSAVTDRALEATERYPNKRLLVHYVQPHRPYLGPSGEAIDLTLKTAEFPHEIAQNPNVTRETIRRAYAENLDIVLEEAKRLLESLPGKTVVSADHGELLGEWLPPFPLAQYGHPGGVYRDPLVRVPWHVHRTGDRPEIRADPPQTDEDDPSQTESIHRDIERNLADLGYR